MISFSQFDGDFCHLKPIMDGLPADLTPAQRREVAELLLRNQTVFSIGEYDIGCTDLMYQSIDTGTHPPIAEPLRRHPRAYWLTFS